MRNLFLVLCILLMATSLRASGDEKKWSISGKISSEKGTALAGASVVIKETYLGVHSDIDGSFLISNVKEGTYSLSVSFIGYESSTREITLTSDLNIDIILKESVVMSDEIIVRGIRASSRTPVAFSELKKSEIEKSNTGQDLPYLLALQPSVVATSESGTGIGYTGLRIRGSDASRINVTLDGIPLNDSESQQVFWVNMPDLASSISDIQIQRGVGTSTNGAGAFGGSINMTSESSSDNPYAEIGTSYGSFYTTKAVVKIGTGLLNERFKLDMRFSGLKSQGYIDRASSNHKAVQASGVYRFDKSLLKANFIYGEEVTGISWWGVPSDSLATNRTYNPAGEFLDNFGNKRYYSAQDDNYNQSHFHLIYNLQLSEKLYLKTAGHFTRGEGYYEQYKEDEYLLDYGLPTWIINGSFGTVYISRTDLIRRKWLYNYYYGGIFNLNYSDSRIDASFGGGISRYLGDHFGRLVWMRFAGNTETNFQWYLNGGQKDEINLYGKVNYRLSDNISLYGDLQYRYIDYQILGTDDDLRYLDIADQFNFFNPKAGLFIRLNSNQDIYASVAVANREPTRANYKDAFGDDEATPVAETLVDFEGAYNLSYSTFSFGANFYYMLYKDQLVPTGKLSNVGYPIMANVENSYRTGLELMFGLKPLDMIEWNASLTLSRNIIKNFVEYSSNYNSITDNTEEISRAHGDVNIAYSPSFIGSSTITYKPVESLKLHFISKYVGKQYFDNTQSEARTIDPYFVNNLRVDYNFGVKGIRDIGLQLQVNNLFNAVYENNAYGGNWYEDMVEYTWAYYFPQAGTNYLLRLTVKF